jgi:dTDP-glucose 4,6-dehydratase
LNKVLILGSNSFGACHLIDDLLNLDFQVIGISRSDIKSPSFLKYLRNPKVKNFQFEKIHLNRDRGQLSLILNSSRPNFIIDFAGQGMVAESWKDPGSWYQTNIVSKTILYQDMLQSGYLQKYIRISTPEVYGNSESNLIETSPYNPSTPYALSHATIDQHLKLLNSQFEFPAVIGRFANFYGPGQQLYRIIPKSFLKFRRNEKLLLHGGGISQRAFIHGGDVSTAIQKLMFNANPGQIYHFSESQIYSIGEVVEKIALISGLDPKEVVETTIDRPGKDHRYLMDTTKAREELGWTTSVDFEVGLLDVAQWIEANIDEFISLSLEYVHVS